MDKPQAVLYLPVQEKQLLLASTNTITKKDHCLVEAPGAGIGQKNTISPTIFFFSFWPEDWQERATGPQRQKAAVAPKVLAARLRGTQQAVLEHAGGRSHPCSCQLSNEGSTQVPDLLGA